MLISREIEDPNWPIRPNGLGRTVGFVFHTPKFWNCRKKDFDYGWLWESPPLDERVKARRYEEWKFHQSCRWPHLHLSYKGYMYWVGPRRRYQLNYMGPLGLGPKPRAWFEIKSSGRYVRWFDNGPTTPRREFDDEDREMIAAISRHTSEEAREIKREMQEYRARREDR